MSATAEERVFEIIPAGQTISRRWRDAKSGAELRSKEDIQLPVGFRWCSEWQVDASGVGADSDGWVILGSERKRTWIRRRERLSSSNAPSIGSSRAVTATSVGPITTTSARTVVSSSGAPVIDVHALKDDQTIIKTTSNLLQSLETKFQDINASSSKEEIETKSKESESIMSTIEKLVERLNVSDKPTVRSAGLKLGGDLLKSRKRFEALRLDAFKRASTRYQGGAPRSGVSDSIRQTGVWDDAQTSREEQLVRQGRENLFRQQMILERREAEHQQVLRNEVANTVEDVNYFHSEVSKINKQSQQLEQAMQQLVPLVEEQGATMKSVVKQMDKALDFQDKGIDELKKAEKYQDESSNCTLS